MGFAPMRKYFGWPNPRKHLFYPPIPKIFHLLLLEGVCESHSALKNGYTAARSWVEVSRERVW